MLGWEGLYNIERIPSIFLVNSFFVAYCYESTLLLMTVSPDFSRFNYVYAALHEDWVLPFLVSHTETVFFFFPPNAWFAFVRSIFGWNCQVVWQRTAAVPRTHGRILDATLLLLTQWQLFVLQKKHEVQNQLVRNGHRKHPLHLPVRFYETEFGRNVWRGFVFWALKCSDAFSLSLPFLLLLIFRSSFSGCNRSKSLASTAVAFSLMQIGTASFRIFVPKAVTFLSC